MSSIFAAKKVCLSNGPIPSSLSDHAPLGTGETIGVSSLKAKTLAKGILKTMFFEKISTAGLCAVAMIAAVALTASMNSLVSAQEERATS